MSDFRVGQAIKYKGSNGKIVSRHDGAYDLQVEDENGRHGYRFERGIDAKDIKELSAKEEAKLAEAEAAPAATAPAPATTTTESQPKRESTSSSEPKKATTRKTNTKAKK